MSRRRHRSVRLLCGALAAPAALLGATATPALAAANFEPTQDCTIDTTALTIHCDDGLTATGQAVDGVADFAFDQVFVPGGVTVRATGSRPLRIRGSHIQITGTLDASGADATTGSSTPALGGPGGGDGGAPETAGDDGFNAPGGGGGGASDATSGAGGGSYAGEGADGGGSAPGPGGTQNSGDGKIRAGSGGGGTGVSGGGGGGTVLLDATDGVDLDGLVDVSGGNGASGTQPGGASGGGSGGLILAHGATVFLGDTVDAHGGAGGAGVCCGYGGGGGGGEIVYSYGGQQYSDNDEGSSTNLFGGGPGSQTGSSAATADGHGGYGVRQFVSDDPFQYTDQTPNDDPYVTTGTRYRLSTLLAPIDVGLPGRTVSLYLKTTNGYALVGTTTTGDGRPGNPPQGEASMYVPHVGNTMYQWRWAGEDFQPPVTQDVTLHVRYAVEVHTNHYSIRHGVPITVYGYVSPSAAGKNAWLKRYSGGEWINVTSAVIKRQKLPNGQTRLSYKFVRSFSRGTVKLEAVKPAGAPASGSPYYEKGTSRILTIKVS